MKKILTLILINLVISILLTLLGGFEDVNLMLRRFLINLLYSNSIGFAIMLLLVTFNLKGLPKFLWILFTALLIMAGGVTGGIIGTIIVSKLLNVQVNFFQSVNLIFFLSISLIFGITGYTIFSLIHRAETNKIKYWKEKQARTQLELSSLRSRINPHFLFNTLNSIAGLIYSNQAKAEEMIEQLAELLRYNLQMTEQSLISLNSEFKAIIDYLNIEKIRFGERLEFKIDNNIENLQLPPLLLLTLVENAIKHGVAKSIDGGKVEVLLNETSEKFILSVFNTGSKLNTSYSEGTGISTLRELLRIQYQKNAVFTLLAEYGGTLAKIEISKGGKL
ncbi:MAG: sensor histidine kinase [Candidatus Stygibacter australis]|nr:sensor histidine kinase [Candidatus Stygibacter australis]